MISRKEMIVVLNKNELRQVITAAAQKNTDRNLIVLLRTDTFAVNANMMTKELAAQAPCFSYGVSCMTCGSTKIEDDLKRLIPTTCFLQTVLYRITLNVIFLIPHS